MNGTQAAAPTAEARTVPDVRRQWSTARLGRREVGADDLHDVRRDRPEVKLRVTLRFHHYPDEHETRWVGFVLGVKTWEEYERRSCATYCPGDHPEPDQWRHVVYEALDIAGQVLYVGRSRSVRDRLRTHRRSAEWWPDMTALVVTLLPCYEQSKYYERHRIGRAKPLFNVPEADYIRRGIETRKRNAAAKASAS